MPDRDLNSSKRIGTRDLPGRAGTVSSDPVMAVAQYALSSGLARDRVENIIGTRFDGLSPGAILPGAVGPDLFRVILDESATEAPALEVAQLSPFSFFGGLERAVLLAPTGKAALRTMAANFSVFHSRLEATYEESSTRACFSLRFPGIERDNGCCNEVVMGVLMRLLRCVFGMHATPEEVRLRYDLNGRRSTYTDFFGGSPVARSSDGAHGLVFRRSDMNWQQPGHDKKVFALSNSRLAKIAEQRRQASPSGVYMEMINASNICATAGFFSVAAVVARAGVSERTAQRIAKSHGTTIARLIEQARLRLLREEVSRDVNVATDDLSRLVGLSDSRALRRALKSWTGKTIREFRESPF